MLMDFKNVLLEGVAEKERRDAQAQAQQEAKEAAKAQAHFDSVSQTVRESAQAIVEASRRTEVTNFPTSVKTPDALLVVEAVRHLEQALAPVTPDQTAVLGALGELKAAFQARPATEAVAVTNLDGLQRALDGVTTRLGDVLNAVRAIEVAPKVDVPAPVVNVPTTDLTPLQSGLKEVRSAVENIRIPSNATHIDTHPLIQYLPADLDTTSAVKYFGYIERTGTWYIRRLDQSNDPYTIRFCFGGADYATAWANRQTLAYDYWGR